MYESTPTFKGVRMILDMRTLNKTYTHFLPMIF